MTIQFVCVTAPYLFDLPFATVMIANWTEFRQFGMFPDYSEKVQELMVCKSCRKIMLVMKLLQLKFIWIKHKKWRFKFGKACELEIIGWEFLGRNRLMPISLCVVKYLALSFRCCSLLHCTSRHSFSFCIYFNIFLFLLSFSVYLTPLINI